MATLVRKKLSVIEQLVDFIVAENGKLFPNRLWLEDKTMKVYVRHAVHHTKYGIAIWCLDIANVEVFEPGKGTFTKFLDRVEVINPWEAVYVESILERRLVDFLRKRGYIQTVNEREMCYYKITR